MFSISPNLDIETNKMEDLGFSKPKKKTLRERVMQYVREEQTGARCHIVGDSVCQYVQKKLRPDNFVRHFRDQHEFEAKEHGFLEDDDAGKVEEQQSGPELVEAVAEPCPAEVEPDPVVKLKNHIPNTNIFNPGTRKDWYKILVRPCVLEDEKGAHCRILEDDSCPYTQKTLRLQNFLRHFKTIHEPEARQKGMFWDEYKDYVCTENVQLPEQKNRNEDQDEKDTRKTCYQVVKPYLLEDEGGFHCQVVVGDSVCNYTQKTLRIQNMLRHFRTKHKLEAREMGILQDGPEADDGDQSQNVVEEQLNGEVGTFKTEVQDSLLEEESVDLDYVPASHQHSSKRSQESRNKKFITKTRWVMKFIHEDQAGAHCRILGDPSCPYTQKTLRVHNFWRHFLSVHPSESRRNGFFRRSKKNRIPKDRSAEESSAQESDRDEQRELSDDETCVKTEEFNVVERGLAQVDAEGGVRCSIEPDSPCQYRQASYDEVRFLAHFRLRHSFLEDVLFPGDGATIPEQNDSVVVGEDGIFCQMDPDSGCDYFQTSYNERKFRQHFRLKHSDEKEDQKPLEKHDGLYRKLRQFMYEDDLGIHCRIIKCGYVQKKRQLPLFLRHFLLNHRKEARQKGFLRTGSRFLKKTLPTYDPMGHIVLYQSYHLHREGLVLSQADGFRCSQEPCDFVRDRYDESTFLEHLRENHPTSYENLKPSKQLRTFKVSEHVLQDAGGFHCRIAGPGVCSYVQRCFRMQNFFRHFHIRHRAEFDQVGFVLPKVQDKQDNCGEEDSDNDRGASDDEQGASGDEPTVAESDTFMDLELSVDQASNDEEEVSVRHQTEFVPRVAKRQWCAQRAKIDELVKVDDVGAFCCNINKKSGCDFVMSFFSRQPFAKHFRTRHPEEAKRHGFFDEFSLKMSKNAKNHKPMVGEFVALDDRGFRCNIDDKSHCSFARKRLQDIVFLKHFRSKHPEEAKRHGLLDLIANSRTCLRTGKRKKFFIHMIRENVMADSRGIHCRIADPLCDYVQEIFRPQNFQRHFIRIHPEEARAKGFIAAKPEPDPMEAEGESTSGDESDDEALVDPAEYCRLCSSSVQPLEPIFKQRDTVPDPLVTMIEHFTGIVLTVESDTSAHICEKCHQRLKNCQRFKQRCQSFDRKVRRKKPAELPEPVGSTPPPLVPFDLDVMPAAVLPRVSFIGVENGDEDVAEQTLIPLDIVKTEETAVEAMDLDDDPFESAGPSGIDKIADVEEELPYARVLNNMLKCGHCELVCQSAASMIEHCREVHGVQAGD